MNIIIIGIFFFIIDRRNINYRSHKNADSSDLFECFNENWEKNVTTFENLMDEWVNKPGYPVVNVVRKENNYEISQKRFLLYGNENSTTKWWVPLTYFRLSDINNNTLPELWLKPNNAYVQVKVEEGDGIIFNTLQTGERYCHPLNIYILERCEKIDFSCC